MKSKFPNSIYPEIIPGIEISCADKVHFKKKVPIKHL